MDLKILRLLATDARMSKRRIARETGMSTPVIADRIARMERSGVIRGYRIEIDLASLGYPLLAYVGATSVQGANQTDVVEALRNLPEVQAVHPVTGSTDLIITLRIRDIEHLRACIYGGIQGITGIMRTETYISLREMQPKNYGVALIDVLLEADQQPRASGRASSKV
jgi:Lrp/AsnC family transcriptional regulator, leucine-responsive regulatory protein